MKYSRGAILVGLLSMASQLGAQRALPANEAQQRNDCRLAARVVSTGHPAPHREWAYGILTGCEESGPEAIAAVWNGERSPAPDELPLLLRATRQLQDRRIYAALRSSGATPSSDIDMRLHALAFLIAYADPAALIFTPSDLRTPPDRPLPLGSFVTHADRVQGSEPVGNVREELRAYYLELRQADPDPVIRNAARILLRHIR